MAGTLKLEDAMYRMISLGFVLAASLVISGCERECVSCSPTSPEQPAPNCTYVVTPLNQNFPYMGGAGNIAVVTQSGCPLTATSNVSWVAITSIGSNGVGDAAQANTGGQRTGTIIVAGQTVTITQDACPPPPPCTGPCNPTPLPPPPPPPPPSPSCTYAVDTTPLTMGYTGENGNMSIGTQDGCTWSASVDDTWLEVSPKTGVGNNSKLGWYAGFNPGLQRTTKIRITNQNGVVYVKSITQAGKP